MNNFLKKVDDLDVGKLKTVPIGMKKLNDVVDNDVAKNQYNTDKENLEKKIGDVDEKIPDRMV